MNASDTRTCAPSHADGTALCRYIEQERVRFTAVDERFDVSAQHVSEEHFPCARLRLWVDRAKYVVPASLDVYGLRVEVDAGDAQRSDLAAPQPGEERSCVGGGIERLQRLQEFKRLRDGGSAITRSGSRKVELACRIERYGAELSGSTEDALQGRERVRNRRCSAASRAFT
jgi:hypothetical protein